MGVFSRKLEEFEKFKIIVEKCLLEVHTIFNFTFFDVDLNIEFYDAS
jgi:hypothetical protein